MRKPAPKFPKKIQIPKKKITTKNLNTQKSAHTIRQLSPHQPTKQTKTAPTTIMQMYRAVWGHSPPCANSRQTSISSFFARRPLINENAPLPLWHGTKRVCVSLSHASIHTVGILVRLVFPHGPH